MGYEIGEKLSHCKWRNTVWNVAYVASCELLVLETAKRGELEGLFGGNASWTKNVLDENVIVTYVKTPPQIKFQKPITWSGRSTDF